MQCVVGDKISVDTKSVTRYNEGKIKLSEIAPMPFNPAAETTLLREVIRAKRAREDADCEDFKTVVGEFGSGFNATCGGAVRTLRQLMETNKRGRSEGYLKLCRNFIHDIEAHVGAIG